MRNLIVLLVGALLGAAAFHVYYLRLDPPTRCGWDHPVDADARRTCRAAVRLDLHGYAVKARRDLDSLIGTISH
jgi:hypothetical protein